MGVDLEDGLRVPVKMLDCDTISQAKEKLLDAMYRVRRGKGEGGRWEGGREGELKSKGVWERG